MTCQIIMLSEQGIWHNNIQEWKKKHSSTLSLKLVARPIWVEELLPWPVWGLGKPITWRLLEVSMVGISGRGCNIGRGEVFRSSQSWVGRHREIIGGGRHWVRWRARVRLKGHGVCSCHRGVWWLGMGVATVVGHLLWLKRTENFNGWSRKRLHVIVIVINGT